MNAFLHNLWPYLIKDGDATNWLVIAFTVIFWPIVLSIFWYWWAHHKRQSVPHFLVTFREHKNEIDGIPYDAIQLTFINQTGSIVYLYHARLKESPKKFSVPKEASRDIAKGWRELVFALHSTTDSQPIKFEHYECVLQTEPKSGRAYATIAVKQPMDEAFYSYRPSLIRRLFRRPKYFFLEYDIVVGEKKFAVRTVY